ncbi:hypothetical protein BUALT_Bualt01G0211200 [Buddleja alternifolia]|uniref:DUF7032 domain-containing protein n=1 Tax=Buddleja alternifolia TaxID=168488 RepID=A0AAV6YAH8_9LAMI|nr:hypothetical protein BUALT_Bualt01G0211200 [Buddleja alternifolia]
MAEDGHDSVVDMQSIEEWLLSCAEGLVLKALEKARQVKAFPERWEMIISKVEKIPERLSALSSHPCFSNSVLCKEQLQVVCRTLNETIALAAICLKEKKYQANLRMQSKLDALDGKLNMHLGDFEHVMITRVLDEVSFPSSIASTSTEPGAAIHGNLRELLALLQSGHLEAKHKALDSLVEFMKEDEKNILAVIGRNNIFASLLVQLLTYTTSPRIREKTVTVICSFGSCENWLVSLGVLPPLIRLVESGRPIGKQKATIALQRLSSMSSQTSLCIVGHGGVRPLIDICRTSDSVLQAASACTLKNISLVPEAHQVLDEEGIVEVMVNLLDCGILLGSKEYAAECLKNLTSSNDDLKRLVIACGGISSLLSYLDGPLPQESAVGALINILEMFSMELIIFHSVLPRLVHVLQSGSLGAQNAAASAICRICSTTEMKRLVGEAGCIPFLVRMLEAEANNAREVAAQAISSLMTVSHNCKKVERIKKSVPNLVSLLDPSPQNTTAKNAIACLGMLSSSKECKKLMVSYGAISHLKKLREMDIPGAKKLHEQLERGKLKSLFKSLFSRK